MTDPDLAARLAARRGLIPVSLELDPDRIVWMDLEQFHCYRGFFSDAINVWASMRGAELYCCTSALDALESIPLPANSLPPTAFIFHAGRCGSTLLAQVLSRSRQNMVFSEAPPHNQIWRKNAPGFRNLVLAMGRRRLPSYRAHIVKFTSFNILRFDQIRAAFPGVPSLFLFREPGAMLASWDRGKPAWLEQASPVSGVGGASVWGALPPSFTSGPVAPAISSPVFLSNLNRFLGGGRILQYLRKCPGLEPGGASPYPTLAGETCQSDASHFCGSGLGGSRCGPSGKCELQSEAFFI